MLSSELKKVVAPMTRIMTIIWGAMITATLFYMVLAWIMYGRATVESVPDAETLPSVAGPVLGVVAFLVVIASIFVERRWFSGAVIMEKLAMPAAFERINPQGGAMGPSREDFDRLPESEKKLACLVPYFQTGMIVIWAMREAVAVFGLVLAIMERSFMVMVPFAVGAALLIAIKAPRPVAFLERVRRLPGAPV